MNRLEQEIQQGVIAERLRALRSADRMDAYLRRTSDNPLPADAAVRRVADRLRSLGGGPA